MKNKIKNFFILTYLIFYFKIYYTNLYIKTKMELKMNKPMCGIDFGTTNSAIAVLNDHGISNVLKIGSTGSEKTVRSVLFFPTNKKGVVYSGDAAVKEYVESKMNGRFLQSIKSFLPSESFTGTNILGFGYLGIDDLIAIVLKNIKKDAENLLKTDLDKVILGRPARFSENIDIDSFAEQRLLIAAQKAGFKEVNFQLEPIAAALHYESYLKKEELVLVADIGGGTSDFTIMRLAPNKINNPDRMSDILSSNGVYIGGDSFNSDIMWHKLLKFFGFGSHFKSYDKLLPFPTHLLSKICRWQDIGLMKTKETKYILRQFHHSSDDPEAIARLSCLINEDLGYSLFCEIEKTKINLSNEEKTNIIFKESLINIFQSISREEFEKFIQDKINKIESAINETLRLASINNIDTVFMTGGSSLIPIIKKLIENKFGKEKISSADSFTSVVSGLALSSHLFL